MHRHPVRSKYGKIGNINVDVEVAWKKQRTQKWRQKIKVARNAKKRQLKMNRQQEIMKASRNKLEMLTEQKAADRALGTAPTTAQVHTVTQLESQEALPQPPSWSILN